MASEAPTTRSDIIGHVDEGFGVIADAFCRNFADYGEVGAALCVHVDGIPVVDIAAGEADQGRLYTQDTLQLIFSATKGVVAVVSSMLEDQGRIDLDAPVAAYWPEFAAAGKEAIPVSWVLSHQAGLPAPPGKYTLAEVLDPGRIVDDLAGMEPLWEPGTRHGYHGITYGWLMNEIIRRVTGRSVGTLLAEEVTGPLGLDVWIGLPEEHEHRVAPLRPPLSPRGDTPEPVLAAMGDIMRPGSLAWRTLTANGALEFAAQTELDNSREMHAAEFPAGNGITTARSLSRLYAACLDEVDGIRLFGPEQVDRARAEQVRGRDEVWGFETAFGLGFWLHTDLHPKLGPGSFGHQGPGCSLGFADPDSGVAFGYVANQPELAGPRPVNLLEAVKQCTLSAA
jgi:CubicO group peptidase (beta-lactamase class C family)